MPGNDYIIIDGPNFVIATDLQNQTLHFGHDPRQTHRFPLDGARRIVQGLFLVVPNACVPGGVQGLNGSVQPVRPAIVEVIFSG